MAFERILPKRLPQNPFKHDPMLKYAVLLCVGITLGWFTKQWHMQWILLCIGLFLMIVAIAIYGLKRGEERAAGWSMMLASAMAMIMAAAGWTQCVYHKVLIDNWPTEAKVWIGNVVNIHKEKERYTTLDLRLHEGDKAWSEKVVRVTFSKDCWTKNGEEQVKVGDELFFHCRLSGSVEKVCPSDFDYADYLTVHHISGTGYVGRKQNVIVWGSEESMKGKHFTEKNNSQNDKSNILENQASQFTNSQSFPNLKEFQPHAHQKSPSTHPLALHPLGLIEGFRIKMLVCRENLREEYARYFKDENLSVLSALTLGDKSLLEKDTQQVFSETGTSHILALSGLHLGILVSIFNFLVLKRLRRWWSRAIGLVLVVSLLWTFTFLVGMPISLLRASTMFTLMQIGVCMGRGRGATLNNLSLSAILLLVADPLSLFDVGFQMSFAAVLAIILAGRYIWQRYPLPVWHDGQFVLLKKAGRPAERKKSDHMRHVVIPRLKNSCARGAYNLVRNVAYPFFCVSVSAQWGTMPLVLYYFHVASPYATFANFVVIPAAYVLLSLALLFFVLPIGMVRVALAAAIACTLDVMVRFLQWMSTLPGSSFHHSLSWWTLVLIWLIPVMVYSLFQAKKRKVRMRLMMATTLCIVVGIMGQMAERINARITSRVLVYKVNGLSAIHFIQSPDQSCILSSLPADSTEKKMTYVNDNYFVPHAITPPRVLQTTGRCTTPYLVQEGRFVIFRHKAVYLLDHPLASVWDSLQSTSSQQRRREVDLMVVAQGCKNSYAQVDQTIHPRRVVLLPNLSARYRKLWRKACAEAHVPCHDVQSEGYFEWPL